MQSLATLFQELFDKIWGNETLLWMLGLIAFVLLVVSLFLLPFFVIRIPVDYFAENKRQPLAWSQQHFIIRWSVLVIKNVFGLILLLLGLAMLVLPGQGLLTLLIGILLINFPGKYRFERWLIRQPTVYRAVAWLRMRAGRPPLEFD